jgi:hypothetical protein
MALPTNDDFANCELSTEELDTIAAGGWFGDAVNWVGHELNSFFTNPVTVGIGAGLLVIGGIVTGATAHKQN